jgi:hypothetical protein
MSYNINDDWTLDAVENNWKAIGCIDPEDVDQLIKDARELEYLYKKLGRRHMSELHELADSIEDDDD